MQMQRQARLAAAPVSTIGRRKRFRFVSRAIRLSDRRVLVVRERESKIVCAATVLKPEWLLHPLMTIGQLSYHYFRWFSE